MRGRILSDPNYGCRIRWGCCRILFSRNPTRILSESDEIHVGSGQIFMGFRQNPCQIPTEKNPTTTLSDPTAIIWIRQDPIPHGSPGWT